jgi:hypothetical protein
LGGSAEERFFVLVSGAGGIPVAKTIAAKEIDECFAGGKLR